MQKEPCGTNLLYRLAKEIYPRNQSWKHMKNTSKNRQFFFRVETMNKSYLVFALLNWLKLACFHPGSNFIYYLYSVLSHFKPMFYFYYLPENIRKPLVSRGRGMKNWLEMGQRCQKQILTGVLKNSFSEKITKIHRETPGWSPTFSKVAGCRPLTLLKRILLQV